LPKKRFDSVGEEKSGFRQRREREGDGVESSLFGGGGGRNGRVKEKKVLLRKFGAGGGDHGLEKAS